MSIVADIMTQNVAFIEDTATLNDARNKMRELSIRHLPVVAATGEMKGLVTQRSVLGKVIALVDQAGMNNLAEAEKNIPVIDVMESHFQIAEPSLSLKIAASYFVSHKHSCLPVVEGGRLVGIVTSQDFVRLCERLL